MIVTAETERTHKHGSHVVAAERGWTIGLTFSQLSAIDPSRTLPIQRAFRKESDRRFDWLAKVVYGAVAVLDVFDIAGAQERVQHVQAASRRGGRGRGSFPSHLPPPSLPLSAALSLMSPEAALSYVKERQYAFPRSSDKIEKFMSWLDEMEQKSVLEVYRRPGAARGVEEAWSDVYVKRAYEQGVVRGRTELRSAGYTVPEYAREGEGEMQAAFQQPIHADRLGLAYTRSFTDLKGITKAMDTQISRVLGEGLARGDGPAVIAKALVDRIDKIGRSRARTLARTEVMKAHHSANMAEYRQAQVMGIKMMAEWETGAKPCDICVALSQKKMYSLDEIETLIPVHPNCMCVALPVPVSIAAEGVPDSVPGCSGYLPSCSEIMHDVIPMRFLQANTLDFLINSQACITKKDTERVKAGLETHVPCDKNMRKKATQNEMFIEEYLRKFKVKAKWLKDNEPYDVWVLDKKGNPKHLIEIKTKIKAKGETADQFTVRKECRIRKETEWEKYSKQYGTQKHMIGIDDRIPGKRHIYYRNDVGSWWIQDMQEVTMDDLVRLFKTGVAPDTVPGAHGYLPKCILRALTAAEIDEHYGFSALSASACITDGDIARVTEALKKYPPSLSNIPYMKALLKEGASESTIARLFTERYAREGVTDAKFIEKRIKIYKKIAQKEMTMEGVTVPTLPPAPPPPVQVVPPIPPVEVPPPVVPPSVTPTPVIPVTKVRHTLDISNTLGLVEPPTPYKYDSEWIKLMKEDYNIAIPAVRTSVEYVQRYASALCDEWDEMARVNPELKAMMSRKQSRMWLQITQGDMVPTSMGDAASGLFADDESIMYLSSKFKFIKGVEPVIGKGQYTVEETAQGLFRHETGHRFQRHVLNKQQRDEWVKLWDDVGKESFFEKRVSTYAGANEDEAFAESFSAYFNSRYQRGSLPTEVERYFDTLLGKQTEVGAVPQSTVAAEWKPASSVKDAAEQLKTRFGIAEANVSEIGNDSLSLTLLNDTGDELARIARTHPSFKSMVDEYREADIQWNLKFHSGTSWYSEANKESVSGLFQPVGLGLGGSTVNVAGSLGRTSTVIRHLEQRSRGISSYTLGSSSQDTLRHEMGHWVHHGIDEMADWDANYEELSNGIRDLFTKHSGDALKKGVSVYAGENPQEMFAEMFNAWTADGYKVGKGYLADWAEEFMQKYFPKVEIEDIAAKAAAAREAKIAETMKKGGFRNSLDLHNSTLTQAQVDERVKLMDEYFDSLMTDKRLATLIDRASTAQVLDDIPRAWVQIEKELPEKALGIMYRGTVRIDQNLSTVRSKIMVGKSQVFQDIVIDHPDLALTADSFDATFSHEYGHKVHELLRKFDRNVSNEWSRMYRELGEDKYFKNKISSYAGGNMDEAFAECFSVWTHPEYRYGIMPREVEEFFSKNFPDVKAMMGKKMPVPTTVVEEAPETTWIKKAYGEVTAKLSAEEAEAVRAYVEEDLFDVMNTALREGAEPTSYAAKYVEIFDKILQKAPALEKELTVYRGVRPGTIEQFGIKKGAKWKDKGFVSTALKKGKTEYFLDEEGSALLEMRVPKGIRAYGIQPEDTEMLLQRGLRFEVVGEGTEEIAGKTVKKFIVEVFPAGEVRVPIKALPEAEKVLRERYGITGITHYGYGADREVVKVANAIDEALFDIKERLGVVFDKTSRFELDLVKNRHLSADFRHPHENVMGRWTPSSGFQGKMELATSRSTADVIPKVGKKEYNVGTDLKSVLRHELGHNVMDNAYKYAPGVSRRWGSEIWMNGTRRDWFKKKVSVYAGHNAKEAFAESFCAYTSPKYKRGMLPGEIEKYFDDLFSVGKG